ncbi:hypothetical protein KJ840_04955 [Patescibacteria group bacterium]|nr:hypothetical protein [Patescibacteria group bacterium]
MLGSALLGQWGYFVVSSGNVTTKMIQEYISTILKVKKLKIHSKWKYLKTLTVS